MNGSPIKSKPDASLPLHILDGNVASASDNAPPSEAGSAIGSLQELLDSIELVSGLEASIYPPPQRRTTSNIKSLPIAYRQHNSAFCQAARRTHDHRGCRGHDSVVTNQRAAELGQPFVQTCHRGVAEVIVPIFSGGEHLGTVFFGQAVTPQIEQRGFDAVWSAARDQVTSRRDLEAGFAQLPRMSEARLRRVGMLADMAIRGLAHRLSDEAFAMEVRLHNAPAIRRAIDLLHAEHCWDTTASHMAERVGLSAAHFSRLFHRVVGETFSAYLNQQRIHSARQLLNHSHLPIVEIARRCGFSRQSYFTRKFREACGMTPTQYRSATASDHHASRPA